MGRKVAILGRAETIRLAPFNDRSWEIWSMPWISVPRADYQFDIHSQARWDSDPERSREWEKCDEPVYCDRSRMLRFRRPIEYPLDDVLGSLPIPFLECTISYQIALAMHEGAEVIGVWGVHMMARSEYAFQRPSVTYLVGLAQGRGIDVVLPEGATLFQSNYRSGRYGIEDDEIYRLRKEAWAA